MSGFDYHRATSVDEAIKLLGEQGEEAQLLAGGHSLLPAIKLRLSSPGSLIDIGHLDELNYIRDSGDTIAIGGATTHHSIETSDLVTQKAPLLAEAAAVIGDVQVRNKGTIGGSLAHADPAADYPAAILAAEAQVVTRGAGGERTIEAADFFVDLFLTSLDPGEIITEIRIPAQASGSGSCYLKFPHPASRFAVVGCAAVVTNNDGTCENVRLAFTGLANAPFRDGPVEDALNGKPVDAASIEAAAAHAAANTEMLSDSFAGEEYRQHLARFFAARALSQAAGI